MLIDRRHEIINKALSAIGWNELCDNNYTPDTPVLFMTDVDSDYDDTRIKAGTLAFIHQLHVSSSKLTNPNTVVINMTINVYDKPCKTPTPVTISCVAYGDSACTDVCLSKRNYHKSLATTIISPSNQDVDLIREYKNAISTYASKSIKYINKSNIATGVLAIMSFVIMITSICIDSSLDFESCVTLFAFIASVILIPIIYFIILDRSFDETSYAKNLKEKMSALFTEITKTETVYADKFMKGQTHDT